MAGLYAVPLYRIPITPAQNQAFAVDLNGTSYRMRLTYNTADEGGWILDIGDASGAPIVAGIPILVRQNLLDSHAHLGIGGGGALFCHGNGVGESEVPTWEGLGETWNLYFSPPTHPVTGSGLAVLPPSWQPAGAVVDATGTAR